MTDEPSSKESELEFYGDDAIASKDAPPELWLILTYISLPIWGVVWFYLFWNGSYGWLDRGYWHELQKAANTTFPTMNMDNPSVYAPTRQEAKNLNELPPQS